MWKLYFVKQTSKLVSLSLILPPPQGTEDVEPSTAGGSCCEHEWIQETLVTEWFRNGGKKYLVKLWDKTVNLSPLSHRLNSKSSLSPIPEKGICKCITVKRKGLNTNLRGGQPSRTQHLSLKLFPQTSALSITVGKKNPSLYESHLKPVQTPPHVVTEHHITPEQISTGCGLVVQLTLTLTQNNLPEKMRLVWSDNSLKSPHKQSCCAGFI